MKGEIIKVWCIVDGYTEEILAEWSDRKTAEASLKYEYDKKSGDHIRIGYYYERGDYGSPTYWSIRELRECECVE